MFHSDDPYGQSSLPYESYTEYSDPFPSQQQAFEKLSPSPRARPSLVNPVAPARPSQAKSTPPRMSKTEALAFVSKCKRWLIAGSIVAFGVLSGLVAGQLTATASSQPANSTAVPGSNSSTDTSSSNGGFFQQQQQQQGGYGFGNGGFGRSSFSGSHTSGGRRIYMAGVLIGTGANSGSQIQVQMEVRVDQSGQVTGSIATASTNPAGNSNESNV